MTERQERLLEQLLMDVSSLQATREETLRQTESLGKKIDSLQHSLHSMWDEKFERIQKSMSNFGGRIGTVERDLETMRVSCVAHSRYRDERIDQLFEWFEKHDGILQRLLQIEHTRKGKTAVIAAIGAFAGTILGGVLVTLIREFIRQ